MFCREGAPRAGFALWWPALACSHASNGDRTVATPRNDRLAPPLMYAFRAAHDKRDAKQRLDLRDEAGERVIATRRVTTRAPISEFGPAARGDVRPARSLQHHQPRRRGRPVRGARSAQLHPEFRLSRSHLAHDRREQPRRDRARKSKSRSPISSRAWRASRSRRGATWVSRPTSSSCAFSSRPTFAPNLSAFPSNSSPRSSSSSGKIKVDRL